MSLMIKHVYYSPQTSFHSAIKAFAGNPHDSRAIEPLLEQLKQNDLTITQELVYDRDRIGQK